MKTLIRCCLLRYLIWVCTVCLCPKNGMLGLYGLIALHLSSDMTKPRKWMCAQRRLRSAWASAQSDQSSLCAQWVAKDPMFLHADSEDSDQTGRMPRQIWVFAGRTLILLVLSCRGSFHLSWLSPNYQQMLKHMSVRLINLFITQIHCS